MITKVKLQREINELKSMLTEYINPPKFKVGDNIDGNIIIFIQPYKEIYIYGIYGIGIKARKYNVLNRENEQEELYEEDLVKLQQSAADHKKEEFTKEKFTFTKEELIKAFKQWGGDYKSTIKEGSLKLENQAEHLIDVLKNIQK